MELDYVTYLEGEYSFRRDVNPAYSMRAFARDLAISPSTLSEVFARKHNLSLKSAMKVVDKLNLSSMEKKNFLDLVAISETRKDLDKDKIYRQIKRRTKGLCGRLSLDLFKVISDWQHFAILELVNLKSFQPDVKWVAEKLEIDEGLVEESLQRLVEIGALSLTKKKWTVHPDYTENFIGQDIPSDAIKKFHRQILMKIMEKINTPIETREYSSTLMSLTEEEYQKITKHIKKFKSEAFSFIGEGKKKDLYALGIQLVPMGRGGKE